MKNRLKLAGLALVVCAPMLAQRTVVIPGVAGAGASRPISIHSLNGSITVKTHAGKDVIVETGESRDSRDARDASGMRRIDPPRDFARDRGFHELAAEEDVPRIGDGGRRDEGSAMPFDRDDMIVRERLQGAAHDRAARIENRAELFLCELGARRQSLIDDRVENASINGLGARAPADRAAPPRRLRRFLGYDGLQHDANALRANGTRA